MATISKQHQRASHHFGATSGTIDYVEPSEQARIEQALREKMAKPRYPAIFYLPQAFEVHGFKPVPVAPEGAPRCSSVSRSEKSLGGSRAGWGGVVREPVGCAREEHHGGPHMSAPFSNSTSTKQTHWEWTDLPSGANSVGDGIPEDAALHGPAAIASLSSGRRYENKNEGLAGLYAPSQLPWAELWKHAGFRFRAAIAIAVIGLAVGMVAVILFLNSPKWHDPRMLLRCRDVCLHAGRTGYRELQAGFKSRCWPNLSNQTAASRVNRNHPQTPGARHLRRWVACWVLWNSGSL
jgi:hypothetical protein